MTRLSARCLFPLVIFLVACSANDNQSGFNDSPEKQKMLQQQRELFLANREKWRAANLLNYEFTRSIDCNCEDKRDMVVSVVNGQVDNAYLNNGSGKVNEGVSQRKLNEYVAIADFFKMIDNAIKHHYDVIDIQYDKEYGYPATMKLLQDNSKSQNSIGFRISNFNMRYTISFPALSK